MNNVNHKKAVAWKWVTLGSDHPFLEQTPKTWFIVSHAAYIQAVARAHCTNHSQQRPTRATNSNPRKSNIRRQGICDATRTQAPNSKPLYCTYGNSSTPASNTQPGCKRCSSLRLCGGPHPFLFWQWSGAGATPNSFAQQLGCNCRVCHNGSCAGVAWDYPTPSISRDQLHKR